MNILQISTTRKGYNLLDESMGRGNDGDVNIGLFSLFEKTISETGRWKAVIRCFLDDSGKDNNPSERIVVMAGYIADESSWNHLTEQWHHLLFKWGISEVHMRTFIPLQGEYVAKNWTPPQRDAILAEFIRAIRISDLTGFGIAVDADAWRSLSREIRTSDGGDGSAHDFCFARILRQVKNRIKIVRPRDFISVQVDADQEFSPTRFKRYSSIKEHDEEMRWYLGEISFSDPKIFAPLQAADLLAWETRKQLIQKLGGYNSTPRWNELFDMKSLSALSSGLDYSGEYWLEKDFEDNLVKPYEEQQRQKGERNEDKPGIRQVQQDNEEGSQNVETGAKQAVGSGEAV
jgi:hypothetical protein